MKGERLELNPIRCDGAGYCAQVVPELIAVDDWGFPIILDVEVDSPALQRLAQKAVAICPVQALKLRNAGGES